MDDEVNDDGQENQEEGELKSLEDNVHYKLYLKGREVWNRWARGAFDVEDAKKYGLEWVTPFSEEEAKEPGAVKPTFSAPSLLVAVPRITA